MPQTPLPYTNPPTQPEIPHNCPLSAKTLTTGVFSNQQTMNTPPNEGDRTYATTPTMNTQFNNQHGTQQEKKQKCCDDFCATFKPGQTFQSPDILHDAVLEFARKYHFSISRSGQQMKCSRAIDPAKVKQRQKRIEMGLQKRQSKSFLVHCPFKLTWNFTNLLPKHLKRPEDRNKKIRVNDECVVITVCGEHGPNCELTSQELQVCLKRGGFLSKFETGKVATVVNMVANDPTLPPNSIRSLMREHMPPDCVITAPYPFKRMAISSHISRLGGTKFTFVKEESLLKISV